MKSDSIIFQIKKLNQLLMTSVINDTNKPSDLPHPTQMLITDYLWENADKEIFQKDIEKMLNVSRATVSDVLRTMEKNGLIKRIAVSNTKRVILLDKAKEYKYLGDKKIKELEELISETISKEEIKRFSEILDIMIQNIGNNALQK